MRNLKTRIQVSLPAIFLNTAMIFFTIGAIHAKVEPVSKQARIAVLPFEQKGLNEKDAGQIVSDLLLNELSSKGWYTVIERQSIQKILDEQKLGLSGIIDDKTAAALGKALGVEALILGSVSKLGNTLIVNCRMVNTTSMQVMKVSTIKTGSLDSIANKINELSSGFEPDAVIPDDNKDVIKPTPKPTPKVKAPTIPNPAYKTSEPLFNLLLPGVVQAQCSDITGYFYMGGALIALGTAITADILYANKTELVPGVHNGIISISGYGLFAVLGIVSTLHAGALKSAALTYTSTGPDQFICSLSPSLDGAQLFIQGRF